MRKGLFVQPDDLEVNNFYAVVSAKLHDDPLPIAGVSFQITAINLPFIIGKVAVDPNNPVTIDTRFLNIMQVTDDYVKAQLPKLANDPLTALFQQMQQHRQS